MFSGGASGVASAGSWTYSPSQQAGALFAEDFAPAGDVNGDGYDDFIVGDAGENAAPFGEPRQTFGMAFVFLGSPSGPGTSPDWIGHESPSDYGAVVDAAGDVNGDGYDDILVATIGDRRAYDVPHPGGDCSRAGSVYVYYGSPTGPSTAADWSQTGAPGECFGFAAAGVGDVNGDGYDDVLVGATWDGWSIDGSTRGDGRAYVYFGSANGLQTDPGWSEGFPGAHDGAMFGVRVGGAGDVDADGFDDILIGGGTVPEAGTDHGVNLNFLFRGQATGASTAPSWRMAVFYPDEFAGVPGYVLSAGDVDGDGFDDVLARPTIDPASAGPMVALFHGSAAGLHTEVAWTTVAEPKYRLRWFAPAGDVNSDGYDDVVVTVPAPGLEIDATVFYGGPNPAPVAQSQSLSTPRGTGLQVTLVATDRYDDPLTFAIEQAPAHGRIDSLDVSNGTLHYIPSADFAGADRFTFSASDPYGNIDIATVDVTISQGAPVFVDPTPDGPLTAEVGHRLEFAVAADDPDGDGVILGVSPRPTGVDFDITSGVFRWTPSPEQVGEWSFEFTADDGFATTTKMLDVTVVPPDSGDAQPDAGAATDADEDVGQDSGVGEPNPADAGIADAYAVDRTEGSRDAEGCGCTSHDGSPPVSATSLILLLIGLFRWRSRN